MKINQVTSDKFINNASLDPLSKIKNLRNVNKVVITSKNMNSLPNKFKVTKELVMKHKDVLVMTEKKLDETLPFLSF